MFYKYLKSSYKYKAINRIVFNRAEYVQIKKWYKMFQTIYDISSYLNYNMQLIKCSPSCVKG